jgi:hypothetical protein
MTSANFTGAVLSPNLESIITLAELYPPIEFDHLP